MANKKKTEGNGAGTTKPRSTKGMAAAGARRKTSRKKTVAGAPLSSAPAPNGPIVGIGCGEGSESALAEIFRRIPDDTGVAFVVVRDTAERESASIVEAIRSASLIPTLEVDREQQVEPDRIYICDGHADIVVRERLLRLIDSDPSRSAMPIDTFFRSLAEDAGARSIGIVLSGDAYDGAVGLSAIKAAGGITIAQNESAEFSRLPGNAAIGAAVDLRLSPDQIADEILRLSRERYIQDDGTPEELIARSELLQKIYSLLRSASGIDFSQYKSTTIERRLLRRMTLHRITSLAQYIQLLQADPKEVEALEYDFLIRVTGFFRDPEVFDFLGSEIFPRIIERHDDGTPIRIWVPGCATGEETYSIAMSLLEALDERKDSIPFQIFGTDVSDYAVQIARAADYPASIASDVSPERLRRFFVRSDGRYRVNKSVRDSCIIAKQNLTRDPPFSKLDLISCRNLMIYLGPQLQRRVLSILHYSLHPDGFLLLGSSETVGKMSDLFGVVDRHHKVYRKKSVAPRPMVEFSFGNIAEAAPTGSGEEKSPPRMSILKEADRTILNQFVPPGVIVDSNLQILQFRGRTAPFLEPPTGSASFDLLKMTREGLFADLQSAIHQARRSDKPVRREAIPLKSNGSTIEVGLEVIPFGFSKEQRHFVILFEVAKPAHPASSRQGKAPTQAERKEIEKLERELDATREYLQSIIEEQEATNEELRSANEEIQSSNEELQSTNEELETAKEELQSSNEELTTLNEELETRNHELSQLNNDLSNLLGSVDIPILMLGSDYRIRRFNSAAQKVLNLIPSDLGRPITDLRTTLRIDDLEKLVADSVDSLVVHDIEVDGRNGGTYNLRIKPYKTLENRIEGAVLTIVEQPG
ncbi:MAG: CheR family methyltransferase [Thermoanaerobaculia bacterium]